jgi:transposase InsO family protein
MVGPKPLRTREAARMVIFEYVEGFYNRTRIHSSLG